MSKAFTKEDDDAGFTAPPSSSLAIPTSPFRLTRYGADVLARHADARVREALRLAEIIELDPLVDPPARAALGVVVTVRSEDGAEKSVRLVSPEELALVGEGCSVHAPLGRTLLGASVGDVRELRAPKGVEELEVVRLSR